MRIQNMTLRPKQFSSSLWRGRCVTWSLRPTRRTRESSKTDTAVSCQNSSDPHGVAKVAGLLRGEAFALLKKHPRVLELIEVVMDLGRPPLARFPTTGDERLSQLAITQEDLNYATHRVGEFGGDNRAGILGTLHRVSCIRNRDGEIVGLTCRVGRDIGGCVMMIADIILSGRSILLMGKPGAGKTTAIRGICRILSDACRRRVVIVDTSNEIAGDGDIPHPGIGNSRRMQVPAPEEQYHVMIEAVENHMPEVVVIDEIGNDLECQAARTISQRGVCLVATAHGCTLENIIKNPSLQALVGGITSVTLGDDEANRRNAQKTVLERESPPVFDVAIEILERTVWRIHHDLSESVDIALAGGVGQGEIRSLADNSGFPAQIGGRPLPPTLPVFPTRLSISSTDEGILASSEVGAVARQSASSAVPLNQNTHASPAIPPSSSEDEHAASESATYAMNPEHSTLSSIWRNGLHDSAEMAAERDWSSGTAKGEKKTVVKLFTMGIDVQLLGDVLVAMELRGKVSITTNMDEANAILATQMGLKMSGWSPSTSGISSVPLHIVDVCSVSRIANSLHSLLGWNLSPAIDEYTPAPPHYSDGALGKDPSPETAPKTLSRNEQEALNEVQCAIEDIVIPRHQSVDLLPRLPTVIKMQMKMVWQNNLECETVGSGNTMHVRIFPVEKRPRTGDSMKGVVA